MTARNARGRSLFPMLSTADLDGVGRARAYVEDPDGNLVMLTR